MPIELTENLGAILVIEEGDIVTVDGVKFVVESGMAGDIFLTTLSTFLLQPYDDDEFGYPWEHLRILDGLASFTRSELLEALEYGQYTISGYRA